MLLIGLTLVIGAGLITNVLCKGYLGRPRPKQLSEFGGQLTYRCFWNPNLNPSRVPQKSLPSGHVAMGFSYLALIVVGRRHELRWLQGIGLCFTLFWGPGLMLARVAQGGHFISDVILAACVMWWTVHVLDLILYQFPWGPLLQSRLNPLSTNGIKNANTTIQNTPKKE